MAGCQLQVGSPGEDKKEYIRFVEFEEEGDHEGPINLVLVECLRSIPVYFINMAGKEDKVAKWILQQQSVYPGGWAPGTRLGDTPSPSKILRSWAAVGTNACLAQVGAKKRGAGRISLTELKTFCILYINIYVYKDISFCFLNRQEHAR